MLPVFSPGGWTRFGGVVNLDHISARRGLEYQQTATRAIREALPTNITLIDADLLDSGVIKSALWGLARPDLMAFEGTTLTGLYEFKRTLNPISKRKDLTKKLVGMSKFLQALRDNPMLLPEGLKQATGGEVIEGPLVIPSDKDLRLVFVSSSFCNPNIEVFSSPKTELKGVFIRVPLSS